MDELQKMWNSITERRTLRFCTVQAVRRAKTQSLSLPTYERRNNPSLRSG